MSTTIINKIYNPKTFDSGYKLYVEQRTGLMKIRNWLWTMDDEWTLQIFDTIWARSIRYGRDWVIDTINQVIEDDFYTEDYKSVLNAVRDEYVNQMVNKK
jgi:hypothetical protein